MRIPFMRGAIVAALAAAFAVAGPAWAHVDTTYVDDGVIDSGKETHHHDSAQHDADDGHLPPANTLPSWIKFSAKEKLADGAGRIADVSAKDGYAYLTAFREPTCARGGVHIVDIKDPSNPTAVGYIPSHTDTFSGEGSQVIALDTPWFKGNLLVYQNEICPGTQQGVGGITLIDVTNPLKPKKLVEGAGDYTVKGKSQRHSNETHSAFAWWDEEDAKAYVVLVDDEEETDVDILDITNPSKPRLVSETDLTQETEQPAGAVHGDAVFLHDMVVKKIDGKYWMLASYWDGGYVKMDVSDPANTAVMEATAAANNTDYAALDPLIPFAADGTPLTPEGNGHQAEFTRDSQRFIATDEDFNPFRVVASITGGPNAGQQFTAIQGSDVPQIDENTSLAGDTVFVGQACAALPAGSGTGKIAVIERGVCTFTAKAQNAEAAGYIGVIVFNRTGTEGCDTLVSMLVAAGIPAVFASRTDGFKIIGQSLSGYTCQQDAAGTGTPVSVPVGTATAPVNIRAVFDGWGYVHLFDANTMDDLDQFAIPESQDPALAGGHGDLSIHEVATDPDADFGYLSYYGGGFRVVSYAGDQLTEVGKFIDGTDNAGNNFWGVEVYKDQDGKKWVLASDRDYGLYVFEVDEALQP